MQEIRPPNPPLSGAPKWARTIRESFANLTRVRFDLHGIPASGRVVRWGTRGVDDVYLIVLDGSNRKVIWPTALCRVVFDGHQEAPAATKPSDAPSAPPSAQNLAIALNPTAAGPADLSADIVRASRAALRSATPLAPSLTTVTRSTPSTFSTQSGSDPAAGSAHAVCPSNAAPTSAAPAAIKLRFTKKAAFSSASNAAAFDSAGAASTDTHGSPLKL